MLRFNTNLIKLLSMQSVQTTEQKQIPGEGEGEMKQGRGRREILKDISLSVLHCSLTSQATAPLSQLPRHNFLYHFQCLNFCSRSLSEPTYRIFWEQSVQLNFPSFISKQKGFIWSAYKLKIFLLMLQHDFAAFRLKLCLLQILSTEILSEN